MLHATFSNVSIRALPALAAIFLHRKDKERREKRPKSWRREFHPYYNLSVKVLRARNIHGADLLSEADCFVQLRLPTASPSTSRTSVVYNSSDPEWNETFHYRIYGAVKNILELTLYDRDVVMDDELSCVVFDLGNVKPGQVTKRNFKLDPKAEEVLEVEFHLEESSDPPAQIITNGVLVAHPCLCVEGQLHGTAKQNVEKRNGLLKMCMPGSYEKQISLPASQENDIQFVFHVNKDQSPKLDLYLQQSLRVGQDDMAPEMDKQTFLKGEGSISISSLPVDQEVEISIPLSKAEKVEMSLKAEDSFPELDLRLGFELSEGERDFLKKRKPIVTKALKEVLELSKAPNSDELPVIAVLGSGGGTRAMVSFYGSLSGLQDLKLLDTLTYISGISGSTWCMSTLYEDPYWSENDLHGPISRARKSVTSSKAGAFSFERLKHCTQELMAMEKEGHKVNFTDFWGLVIEYFLHQQGNPAKLSDQQVCVSSGQNPYPIYAGVNVRVNINVGDFSEWCEFTPHEIGFRKYGAFVRTEDFGSEFFMGHLIHRRKEPKICYLQGVWGSAFAANLDEIWATAAGTGIRWLSSLTDVIKVIDDCRRLHFHNPNRLQTRLVMPAGIVSNIFQDFFKSRFTAGERYNFIQGLYLYKNYVGIREFVAWKGNHLDAFPNHLTPMEENLYLVDGGLAINSPFPLVLQPEREVDVILSFNYSWDAPFKVLHQTSQYCRERGIPFPDITISEEDEKQLKECYVFMDPQDPRSPIVLHFPMVNETFCRYKAPGFERETEEEKSFGNVVLSGNESPYRTKNFTYEPNHFDQLVEVNKYNVLNNQHQIAEALRTALSRRKQRTARPHLKKHMVG
ncbi:cytosolic phospholipase A2 zeta [Bombina bombina]|uniref:cytosolic phospholipase A2 zeta n=1 Tax=Bombina bombina TaxID=8345 RepID=UPI00235A8795|nr:cytosolic phospholipase A2 zeta [Bombina bombina]